MMDEDKLTLVRVETQLENLMKLVQELTRKFDETVITKPVWDERNAFVENRFETIERRLDAAKVNWISVGALILSVAMLAWNFAGPLIQHITTVP